MVPLNGTSKRATELILMQNIPGGREEVPRIQLVILEKFMEASVKVVGSRLADDVDHRSFGATDVGGDRSSLNF